MTLFIHLYLPKFNQFIYHESIHLSFSYFPIILLLLFSSLVTKMYANSENFLDIDKIN